MTSLGLLGLGGFGWLFRNDARVLCQVHLSVGLTQSGSDPLTPLGLRSLLVALDLILRSRVRLFMSRVNLGLGALFMMSSGTLGP